MKGFLINIIFTSIGAILGVYIKQIDILPFSPSENTIVEKIQKAAKLITIEHFVTDIVEFNEQEPWYKPDQKAIVIAKAKVSAGFDLSKDISVSVSNPEHLIKIRLPKPQILSIDPTYKYYDIKGQLTINNHNALIQKAKATMRQVALQAGILDQATRSIKDQLELYFEGYSVDVQLNEPGKTDQNKLFQ
ncbi:hypothetical protein CWO84_01020 [Methylomonas sp. Kb3]|uniref:DUF4230 domain-containing protein n=1 Tax=Methylomonas sp. Kb3 TaxID=1611544 RepID=UPI000C330DBC|nr:DUF4230 domain-containing protein [Methylomonas sp. Kb3]PKD42018.1 hypothetical protein CWO84_01020 [Methylomonas sp. Kb3]